MYSPGIRFSKLSKKLLRGPIAASRARLVVAYLIWYVSSRAPRLLALGPLATLFLATCVWRKVAVEFALVTSDEKTGEG